MPDLRRFFCGILIFLSIIDCIYSQNTDYPYESGFQPRLSDKYPYRSDYSARMADLYSRASVFIKSGNYKEAIELFKDVIKKHPGTPEVWNNLGFLYEKTGEFENAEFSYKKAIFYDSNYSDALNNLGFLYCKQKKELDVAFRMLSRAIELKPKSKYYHDSLGYYHMITGNKEKAKNHFFIAVHYDKNFASPHFHLGLLYGMDKDYKEMIRELEFALKLQPDWNHIHYYLYDANLNIGEFAKADKHHKALKEAMFLKRLPEDIKNKFNERNYSNLQISILQGISEIMRTVFKTPEEKGAILPQIENNKYFSNEIRKFFDETTSEKFFRDDNNVIFGRIHGINGYVFEKKTGYESMEMNYSDSILEIENLISFFGKQKEKIINIKLESGK